MFKVTYDTQTFPTHEYIMIIVAYQMKLPSVPKLGTEEY